MEFKTYKYAQLKDISEDFIRNNNIKIKALPTDIELLIEKSGIIIESINDLLKEFSVKGLVTKDVKNRGKIKIFIDSKHYEEDEFEYKFTLAEELAHSLLHIDLYDNINDVENYIRIYKSISEEDYRKYEQQARNLASFLLLPEKEFNKYVLDYIDSRIDEFQEINFQSAEDFADKLSNLISKKLVLSHHVIYWTMAKRYPERLVDIIKKKYFGILKI